MNFFRWLFQKWSNLPEMWTWILQEVFLFCELQQKTHILNTLSQCHRSIMCCIISHSKVLWDVVYLLNNWSLIHCSRVSKQPNLQNFFSVKIHHHLSLETKETGTLWKFKKKETKRLTVVGNITIVYAVVWSSW